jgi:AcrR family transcriptional regulator
MPSSRTRQSEHTRRQVLDAALDLFSTCGYRSTTIKQIAEAANVSTGNVYHHFPDKEAIFRTLLEQYAQITSTPKFPLVRALNAGPFPENIEQIARASRESVQQYRKYMALHLVDVIEFDGSHIRRFYRDIAERFAQMVEEQRAAGRDVAARLRPGVSPQIAMLLTARLFFHYFQLETLFGVEEPYGESSEQVLREIIDILLHGIVRPREVL